MPSTWAANDWISSDAITAARLNDIGNSIRTWQGQVNANGQNLAALGQLSFSASGGVLDGTPSAPGLRFASDQNTGIYRLAADTMQLVVGGTAKATVSSAGLSVVGLMTASGGISATAGGLSVTGGAVVTGPTAGSLSVTDGINSTLFVAHSLSGYTNPLVLGSGGSANMVFVTNGSARMHIRPDGWIILPGLPGYANDAAAGTGGAPSGALYWNTSNNSLMRKA